MSGSRDELIATWKRAVLETASGAHPRSLLEEGLGVHVITAWNPGAELCDLERNRQADEVLERALGDLGVRHIRTTGRSADNSWREEGWSLVGSNRELALALAKRCGQLAIYEFSPTASRIIMCDSGEIIDF
jgi:Protein of unknown function (DUF3293)